MTQQTAKRRLRRPESHSPEFEREAVRTMRLFRVLMYIVFGVLALVCVLLVVGVVASFAFGGHSVVSAGADQHADLKAGAALHASTEAGVTGDVQILSVQRDASTMTITAKVKGMAGAATLPNSWQVYLWGDTRAPMTNCGNWDNFMLGIMPMPSVSSTVVGNWSTRRRWIASGIGGPLAALA